VSHQHPTLLDILFYVVFESLLGMHKALCLLGKCSAKSKAFGF
jgi:hypothetical protein